MCDTRRADAPHTAHRAFAPPSRVRKIAGLSAGLAKLAVWAGAWRLVALALALALALACSAVVAGAWDRDAMLLAARARGA